MSEKSDFMHAELAEALRRMRALLAARLSRGGAGSLRGLPWVCWLVAAAALVLAWSWPQARVIGVFFALAAIVASAFLALRAAAASPAPASALDLPAPGKLAPKEDPLAAFSDSAPLRVAQSRFGLSDFEARVLLLCAAAELDPCVPELLCQLQDGGSRQPVFGFAQQLFPGGAWDSLSENRPLLHWLMIEARQQDGRPLAQSPLRIDDGMLQYLIGNPSPDVRLLPYHVPFPPDASDAMLSKSQKDAALELKKKLSEAVAPTPTPLLPPTSASTLSHSQEKGPHPGKEKLGEVVAADSLPPERSAATPSGAQEKVVQAVQEKPGDTAAPAPVMPVVTLTGPYPLAQQMTALAVVAAAGGDAQKLMRVPLSLLPSDPRDAEHLGRLWAREAILHGLAIYLEADDTAEATLRPALRRFFLAQNSLYFVASREPIGGIPRATLTLPVARPLGEEQQKIWRFGCMAAGLTLNKGDAMCLADQFHLDLPVIFHAIVGAQDYEFEDSAALRRYLQLAVRKANRTALDLLAQRIEPRATMDDLVLPRREKEQLEKFIAHVELRRLVFSEWGMGGSSVRGQGTAALFSGESGTGKTLAAEVVAARLGLDLYRVDLSAVVDKYIGETEKNLRRIFDAAEAGGVILFFDEADALFGKRSEVKDSHDRFANIQINYLLQRLETYRGPAVLATNLGRSMDQAFLRRLRFIVRFPQPNRDERRQIWEKSLAPLTDNFFDEDQDRPVLAFKHGDFHAIAATALSGGEIRNAAIHAAFLAASRGQPVTRSTVEEAINDENQKAGRPATAGGSDRA